MEKSTRCKLEQSYKDLTFKTLDQRAFKENLNSREVKSSPSHIIIDH